MNASKAQTILRLAGYTETTEKTFTDNHLAHVVYLVTDVDESEVVIYQQSTRAVRRNFTMYKKWLATGAIHYLPNPIKRHLSFTHSDAPQNYVRAYHLKGKFIGDEVVRKLLTAGYQQIGRI